MDTTNRDATLPLSPRRVLHRRRHRQSPCADPGKPPHLLASLRLTSEPGCTAAGPPTRSRQPGCRGAKRTTARPSLPQG